MSELGLISVQIFELRLIEVQIELFNFFTLSYCEANQTLKILELGLIAGRISLALSTCTSQIVRRVCRQTVCVTSIIKYTKMIHVC